MFDIRFEKHECANKLYDLELEVQEVSTFLSSS